MQALVGGDQPIKKSIMLVLGSAADPTDLVGISDESRQNTLRTIRIDVAHSLLVHDHFTEAKSTFTVSRKTSA
jgi:hypothetical protein